MYNYSFKRSAGDVETVVANVIDDVSGSNCPVCGRPVGDFSGGDSGTSGSGTGIFGGDFGGIGEKTSFFRIRHHPLCPHSPLLGRRFCYECGAEIASGDSFVLLARHCFCLDCVDDNTVDDR